MPCTDDASGDTGDRRSSFGCAASAAVQPSLSVKTAPSWRGIVPFTHLAREGRMTVTLGRRELLVALGGVASSFRRSSGETRLLSASSLAVAFAQNAAAFDVLHIILQNSAQVSDVLPRWPMIGSTRLWLLALHSSVSHTCTPKQERRTRCRYSPRSRRATGPCCQSKPGHVGQDIRKRM